MGCACRRRDGPAGPAVEGAEAAPAVLDHLAACDQELGAMESLDGSLTPLRERCTEAMVQLQDLARDLDRYAGSLESDPARLAGLQERLAQLRALERRHGLDLAALIESGARSSASSSAAMDPTKPWRPWRNGSAWPASAATAPMPPSRPAAGPRPRPWSSS